MIGAMWRAALLAGVVVLAVGLSLAAYANEVSSWRARVYGEPARPATFFAIRGGVLALIGAVVAGLGFFHP